MKKEWLVKTLALGVIVLFICMNVNFSLAINNVKKSSLLVSGGNILYVGGSGPGNYSRIQDAVDNASDGDTVFVFDDSSPYVENIVVNKSIFLIGEDKNTVVIDGDFKDMVITITVDDVFVSGFTMIHPHKSFNIWDSALVDIVSSENVTIKNNIIQQNRWYYGDWNAGIIIRNSSYCFIQNNTISTEIDSRRSVGIAVIFGSTFNNVSGNEIYHFTVGIWIYDVSTDNVIYLNYLHHNLEGVTTRWSNNNIINNNVIIYNTCGIWIEEACYNVVFRNIITNNGDGNFIDGGIVIITVACADNYISYNNISNNNPYGIKILSIKNTIKYNLISKNNIGVFCDLCSNNYIIKNNFILNEKNGYFLTSIFMIGFRNFWRRNYWDEPRSMPYLIFGEMTGIFNMFTWVNFDWFPAQKPYNIEV